MTDINDSAPATLLADGFQAAADCIRDLMSQIAALQTANEELREALFNAPQDSAESDYYWNEGFEAGYARGYDASIRGKAPGSPRSRSNPER